MRLVRLGFMLSAAVFSAQATLEPLGLAGVQTPSTAPASPPGVAGAGSTRRESSGRAATAA